MPRYRARPLEVEATQWHPNIRVEGVFMEPNSPEPGKCRYFVVTIHGQKAYLKDGDYIITEPDGQHHYPCKPDIFEAKYEPIAAAAAPPALMAVEDPMGGFFGMPGQ